MTKLHAIALAAIVSFSACPVMAAAVDNNDVVPPAQVQKNQVPDSTANGNYLETQPDENGATGSTTDKQNSTMNKHNYKSGKNKKGAKATNVEKSKRFTDTPENGGTEVKQQ